MNDHTGRTDPSAHSDNNAAGPPGPNSQEDLEHALRAQLAAVTGLAPEDYAAAWWDWYLNLAKQPPAQAQLAEDALAKAVDNWNFAMRAASGEPLPPVEGDARYGGGAWAQWPFNVLAHSYRNYADWWQNAWSNVPGVTPESERTLDFLGRNALEVVSPSNYLATNPELLETTRTEAGANLVRGFGNWLEDVERTFNGNSAGAPERVSWLAATSAATPGKVCATPWSS